MGQTAPQDSAPTVDPPPPITTSQAAAIITAECGHKVEPWQVRRIYSISGLTEPPRFDRKRAIDRRTIPQIVDALRAHGWLPAAEEVASA